MTEEERIEILRRSTFPDGELAPIVRDIHLIESVCGRVSRICVGDAFEVRAEWVEGGHRFYAVFEVPGAHELAADIIRHDIRLPLSKEGR